MTRSRRIIFAALGILGGLVLILIAAVVSLQTSWGQRQLAKVAERQAERALDADISIGSIEGNLLRSPTIHELSIGREGEPLITADRVELQYDAGGLIGGELGFHAVTLVNPVIHLVEGPDGISLFDLFQRDTAAPSGPSRPFSIDDIRIISGRIVFGPGVIDSAAVNMPTELRQVQGRLSIAREGGATAVGIEHLEFVGVEPRLVMQRLKGGIRYADGDLIFERLEVRTERSELTVDGALENLAAAENEP